MIEIQTYPGETTGVLNVELREGVNVADFIARYNLKPEFDFSYHNMFGGRFDQATVKVLQNSPDVVYMEEDPVMYACAAPSKAAEAK
ncbi:hypothetical protein BD779DRAFT_1575042 [Infundibulicybe gibba]|nr:hypothetical protein BD779DRAFT_1579485 [Infundibulicybe gibba]KAF8871817.1 hypothetical protein BD779DRAFT_1575042 [Infundibulicybe gibba]